ALHLGESRGGHGSVLPGMTRWGRRCDRPWRDGSRESSAWCVPDRLSSAFRTAGGDGPHGSGEMEVLREHLLLTAVRGEVLAHRRLPARRDLGARDRLLGGIDVVRLEVAHDHAVLGPQEEGVVAPAGRGERLTHLLPDAL